MTTRPHCPCHLRPVLAGFRLPSLYLQTEEPGGLQAVGHKEADTAECRRARTVGKGHLASLSLTRPLTVLLLEPICVLSISHSFPQIRKCL